MTRRICSLALSSIAIAAGLVAVPSRAASQKAGVTSLPDSTIAKIDRAFAFATSASPGCAVGVSRAGTPVLTRAWGMANLEYDVPNTPETIFESGSVAKQFTAASVVLLQQDGRLSLDDDIRKWLPEVPDFGKTITIRHLLTHTSGLRDQWGMLALQGNPPGAQVHSLATILDLVAHQRRLNFDPGTEYLYSNTGFSLAAIIVQRASGKSLAEFSRERLFAPLGMTQTRWRDDYARIVKGRATAYDGVAQMGFRQDMPFTNVYGNGGLLTTVGDLLKWNAYLDAPPANVGGPALVTALQTSFRLVNGKETGYGLGLGTEPQNGVRAYSHGGATAGYRTWLARYPDDSVSIAVLCNGGSIAASVLGWRALLDAGLVHPPARAAQAGAADSTTPALTAEQLGRYTGSYLAARPGLVLRTVVQDGKLTATQPGRATLAPSGTDRFRIAGQSSEIVFLPKGGRADYAMRIVGTDTVRFARMAEARTTPTALAPFAGSYWSPEIDSRVTMVVKDSTLVVKQRPETALTLTPVFKDGFTHPQLGTLIFRRDAAGKVTGFAIWAGRVRDVRFDREK